ncbi:uncharacterized protein DC041_0011980 [Schistosoma bovis]|uniref:Uncharacterized protein n=1 Tax=Schistosoma bovis TaxID=6184 RepID=A0A430QU55_SCHBO|nr:uncharacterized protein DC041_0011980 [Schistosoma bovis]
MSQIGSAYQNKLRMQSPNTLPSKQKSEILYNTNHSTYTTEYQETFNENKKLPKKDSIETVENVVEQQQHREQQTTVGNFKWYEKLSNCCDLSVLKQHIRNSLTNTPTPKSLCILHKLHHSHLDRSIGRCSLNKCIQLYACRNCNFKHSLVFITFFSILLNLPLFFVQKVVRKNNPIKKSAIKQMENNKTTGQIPQAFAYITIFEAFNRHFGNVCKRWRCCPPYLIYRSIAHMLGLFTYSTNFFVYLTLNKHFKQQLNIWFLLICPISKQFRKKCLLKQNKSINHSYDQSKSKLSFTNQHKSISLPHNNLYYRMCKRRRSSTLFCNPTKRLISIDNTDLSSEAVSAPVDLCTNSKWKNRFSTIK